MCGIYGEFNFSGSIIPDNAIRKLQSLSHRGPDGFGWECGDYSTGRYTISHNTTDNGSKIGERVKPGNYFFGHRRLSIVDLNDSAFQPMENCSKYLSVIFNGEIYNYIELRRELEQAGCEFKTDHSDTEVLLNAYQEWGENCLDKLQGMFAFAIFDRKKRLLFFARDRIGKKPFYFEFNREKFCFSSELGPLVKFNDAKKEIDEEALYQYLLFGYVLHPHSIFRGINKLSPACYGIIDLSSRKFSIHKYWDISIDYGGRKTFDEYVDNVDYLLNEAVSVRLRADVPIGAFISGGTDSTLVIKKIKEITGKQYDVFGADFPGTIRSEKKYIEEAATYYDQRLHLSNIDLSHAKNISDIIAVFDEPFDGGSAVAVFDLFHNVGKEQYKVILTGDGGDELFAGYERYQQFLRNDNILKMIYLPPVLKRRLKKYLQTNINHRQKVGKLLYSLSGDKISSFNYMGYDFSLANLMRKHRDITIHDIKTIEDISTRVNEENFSCTKAAQYFEMKTILPGRMLYKIDRFSMFFGIEARAPFLDHRLVEFAFNIPDKYNIDLRQTKKILKAILSRDFPDSFVHRKKQGFGNPFDLWFSGPHAKKNTSILLDRNSLIYEFIDYEGVHNLFPNMTEGFSGWRAKQLWRLIVLGHFLENSKSFMSV